CGAWAVTPLSAQMRFTVDPKSSLAWWQVQPHLGHLWATTCPEEPSWFTGHTHSDGYRYDVKMDPMHGRVSNEAQMAKTPVPVYRGRHAKALCTQAVKGEISVADTSRWRGVRGLIVVRAEALVTGFNPRDDFARKRVLQTDQYPDVRFAIDSLTEVKSAGDTL